MVYLAGRITPGFNTTSEQLSKGFITGVNIDTRSERFYMELKSPVISSLVIVNRKLYFACEDGTVYSYADYS
jgi:hypothetical protein